MDAPDEMVAPKWWPRTDSTPLAEAIYSSGACSTWVQAVDVADAALSVPALAEVIARVSELEADLAKVVAERDEAQDWADRLAAVAGGPEVIGEHSNLNNPWRNAFGLLVEVIARDAKVREIVDEPFLTDGYRAAAIAALYPEAGK